MRRAVESGHRPHSFLMAPRWVESLSDVWSTSDAPCYVLDESAIESLTGFHVHRGALAAMYRPTPRSAASVLAECERVIVMEDLVDHTNVGAIFRSAAALGFDGAVLSPRCADPLYRRAIKVSMGSVFSMPYARATDWYGLVDELHERGFTSYAMTLGKDSVDLATVRPPASKVALIVGSEGHGLSTRWESSARFRVTIPMARGIDSLNVAASVAVACWQLNHVMQSQ